MDHDILKTFCIVANQRSFSKASESLQITQSTVSRRIQNLEDELGVPLLLRTPHSVILTKEGNEFLAYAERSVQIIEEGTKKVKEKDIGEKLIVAGTPTICFNILPEILDEFIVTHSMRVSVNTTTAKEVFDMLVDQTADIGFTTANFPSPYHKCEIIYSEELICVGHPNLVKQYVSEGEVIRYPVPIMFGNHMHLKLYPYEGINNFILKNPQHFKIVFEASLVQVIERMARKGIGFAILPASEVKNGLETGELVRVSLPNLTLPKRPIYMITYKNRQMKRSVAQFRKTVKRHFAKSTFLEN